RSRTSPSSIHGSGGGSHPVSSRNSRLAVSRGSSSASTRPLITDQAPSSFPAQNGPPGWAMRTSRAWRKREGRMPAEITAGLGVGGPPTIPSDVVDRGSTAAPVRPVGGRGAALIWRQLKRAARQFTIGGVGTTLFAGATVVSSYVLG